MRVEASKYLMSGDKLKCVASSMNRTVQEGQVYTFDEFALMGKQPHLYLKEVQQRTRKGKTFRPLFNASRFVPVADPDVELY